MSSIVADKSRAILIGASQFPRDPANLPPLAAVKANVSDLEQLLTDPNVVGIPRSNVIIIMDEDINSRIAERVAQAARDASDTLIVYYAGHGLIGRASDLYLATSGTTQADADYNALPFNTIRNAIRESPATKRILILDCCFSGRALEIMSNEASLLRAEIDIRGTYALASAPANKPAMAPEGARYTAFTGELIRILDEGLDIASEEMTLEDIYEGLKRELRKTGLPEPQQAAYQDLNKLRFARNRLRLPTVEDRIEALEKRLDQQIANLFQSIEGLKQRTDIEGSAPLDKRLDELTRRVSEDSVERDRIMAEVRSLAVQRPTSVDDAPVVYSRSYGPLSITFILPIILAPGLLYYYYAQAAGRYEGAQLLRILLAVLILLGSLSLWATVYRATYEKYGEYRPRHGILPGLFRGPYRLFRTFFGPIPPKAVFVCTLLSMAALGIAVMFSNAHFGS